MPRRSIRLTRRTTFLVLAAMTALMIGALLVRLSGGAPSNSGRSTAVSSRPPAPARKSSSVRRVAALAARSAASRRGAVAAAVAYATGSQRWLYFTDEQIRAAIASIATPTAASRLITDVVNTMSTARDQLRQSSGRVWWLVRPLAWRVDDYRADQARVSVWTVTILSAARVAAPQSEYVTVTLDLAWVAGGWRVDGVRDTPGPTPITGPHDQPWDAEPFDHALDGFTRVDAEPGR